MSQEIFFKIAFFTTQYEQIVNLEHLVCPEVKKQSNFESVFGRGLVPPAPLSYACDKPIKTPVPAIVCVSVSTGALRTQ